MTQMRHIASRRKKYRPQSQFLRDSSIDTLDFDLDDSPFYDDELLTLDEFEVLHSPTPVVEEKKPSTCCQRLDPPERSAPPRQKVARRRSNPATCERAYTTDEVEFMNALSEYKRNSGRMFPNCSEILEILKGLGYEKIVDGTAPEVVASTQ